MTDTQSSRRYDGEEFIVRRIDPVFAQKQSEHAQQAKEIMRHVGFPRWLNLTVLVLLMIGLIVFAGALDAVSEDSDVPFETMVQNGFWYYFGFGGGVALLCGACLILDRILRRRTMNSPAVTAFLDDTKKLERASLESMLVPESAAALDIYTAPMKFRFGKLAMARGRYANEQFYAFRDGEALCLADIGCVMRIPFERITSVACVKRHINFVGWNKEPVKGKYRGYKVMFGEFGSSVKPYYRVEIMGKEPYELLFPPYEFETIAPLLGSRALTVIETKQ